MTYEVRAKREYPTQKNSWFLLQQANKQSNNINYHFEHINDNIREKTI